MKFTKSLQFARHALTALYATCLSLGIAHAAYAGAPAQYPVIIGTSVKPIMMLNMSRDHQLFFKLYDDYSDITDPDGGLPDKIPDTGYNNNYDYYGYFDSDKCYTYVNSRFEPSSWRTKSTKSCDGDKDWSGNFLNWATMTRADAVRKILYGGSRVVDTAASGSTAAVTVLERAFLPNDAHSFAKFYLPKSSDVVGDLKKVVPDGAADESGVTICNTTNPASRVRPDNKDSPALSQNVTEPPLMKVAKGNYALWANNERWQCLWSEEMTSNGTYTETAPDGTVEVRPANLMRQWDGMGGKNGNNAAKSFIHAQPDSPNLSVGHPPYDFNVRVRVCVDGYIAGSSAANNDDYKKGVVDNENCKQYSGNNIKPTGLLHKYGENDAIRFGLITGSYSKNKSGGVLRKPVSSFKNEVSLNTYDSAGNLTQSGTGQFLRPALSIVNTVDKLRIFGYNFGEEDGLYNIPPSGGEWNAVTDNNQSYSDNCSWYGYTNATGGISPNARAYFENGRCTNWGNPQAEIYLESLRYLAGAGAPSTEFDANDSKKIAGLNTAPSSSWTDPIQETESGNYCAPLNILQFNASTTSYDGDQLGGATGIGLSTLNDVTKTVGDNEGITNGSYFVGKKVGGHPDGDGDQLCTPKSISDLATVNGLCPEAPRLEGSYQLAGLAYHARSVGLPAKDDDYGREKVRTFGVALAPAVPKVTYTEGNYTFTILPACRNLDSAGAINGQIVEGRATSYNLLRTNCAIVDFKVVQKYDSATGGKVYVSWEDMEQGGDYDQDMWGIISYKVVGDQLHVTTEVVDESTDVKLGFGYVVSGVEGGGFKVHSGIKNFRMDDTGCSGNCNVGDGATTVQYTLGTSTDKDLKDPLFYAAKWGGYSSALEAEVAKNEGDLVESIKGRDTSDSYFYATDPRALEQSLETALANIAATVGASATVAANSTRLDGETFVYQARFNSSDWSGDILAFKVDVETGLVDTSSPDKAKWRASEKIQRTGRTIYTYDGASTPSLVKLTSAGPTAAPTLREALKMSGETGYAKADNRFYWLLGSADNESKANLRKRDVLLGDIVNADPAFAGAGNLRYRFLPKVYGSGLFPAFAKEKREIDGTSKKRKWRSLLLVGANDGMMHALDAETGVEVFAYIPRGVYSKLADLSSLQYRHQYTVDGPISIGDVYFDENSDGTGGEWRTIAVGTLGAGGRGVYALDITDVLKSSTGAPRVIFDVSAEDPTTDADLRNALGYSMSRPLIVPTRDSNWKVILGNGPNSNNGTASLITIDPEDPENYKIIDSGAKISTTSTDNGLFGVALLPNANGVTEAAYGGDLMGNMWKFDLSGTDSDNWDVAYDNEPLVRVVDKSGVPQPITATPTLGSNALKTIRAANDEELPSTMVYFGTGKYYESADPRNMQVQSVYGIADVESLIFTDNADRRDKLEEKEITAEVANGEVMTRTITNDATPLTGTPSSDGTPTVGVPTVEKHGWFIDLQLKGGSAKGERVIGKPLLIYDRLIFSTFVPSTNQCGYGGAGWLMELTGVGDKYVGKSVLGVNANTSLDTPILGDLIALSSGDNLHIMGSGLGKENLEPPIISKQGNSFGDKGRISWQQLK